jgi:hypothetical protein
VSNVLAPCSQPGRPAIAAAALLARPALRPHRRGKRLRRLLSTNLRLLDEEEQALGRNPRYEQEYASRDGQRYERTEMVVVVVPAIRDLLSCGQRFKCKVRVRVETETHT